MTPVRHAARGIGLAWLAAWTLAAVAAAGFGGVAMDHDLPRALGAPEWPHLLGFDSFGRDLLVGTLRGSAHSGAFAAIAAAAAVMFGLALGSAIAVVPDRARFAMERLLEGLLAFPYLLFALGLSAIRGPGWVTLLSALLVGSVPSFARIIQGRARELMAEDYVAAARGLGASPARIATRHLAPGMASICLLKAPSLFAQALMAEATLTFLGVGAPVGEETWGALLAQGKDYLIEAPHIAFGTGLPLVLTILSLQALSRARNSE